MKYIYLIITLFLITGCTYKEDYKEDYNILEDNSIRFIKENNSTTFLINKDNTYYLLPLSNSSFNEDVDYLIKINNTKYNIKYKEEYILKNDIVLQDIEFKINDKIEIIINNKKFCIYLKELNRDNFMDCDFIYLYNIDKDFYITLNNNILVLFYDSYTKFNYKFMYELSRVWIDSYTIDSTSYTTLTLYEDNFNVSSYKIRSKTIHKE